MALEDKIEDLSTRVGKAINDLLPDTWYQRSDLPLAQQTSIQIYKTSVMINGKVYKNTSATTLSLNTADSWDDSTYATASKRAGVDFYIYACVPASGTVPVFKLSANSTVPTGYSASTSRKIGGFHCLCLAVGTISGHTLTGYATGDILPLSVWDLKFHAVSGSEGMIYKNGLWTDIYLAGWSDGKLVSQFNTTLATGSHGVNLWNSYGFSGESFAEYATYVGKRLIDRQHFMAIAEGCNQRTGTSTSVTTSGGHSDTAGRRMISNCGCEDCCGALWQWASDICDTGPTIYDYFNSNEVKSGPETLYTNSKIVTGRGAWNEMSVFESIRTGTSWAADYYTKSRGAASCSYLCRLLVGGNNGNFSGSRSITFNIFSSFTGAGTFGARLVSLPYYS